jgi:hypothetical protein
MNVRKLLGSRKYVVLTAAAALAVLTGACGATRPAAEQTRPAGETVPAPAAAGAFRAELKTDAAAIEAGRETALVFHVTDAAGALVKNLEIVHEKPMHLLIASRDLAEFYHIHPEPQADGSFRVAHVFPHGGAYRLYADFTPPGAKQTVERIDLKVGGPERAPVALTPDAKYEKTVDGLKVRMTPGGAVKAGQELMLDFAVFDAATDRPAADLENYLGELAHFVIISEDMKDFVHAHPMSPAAHDAPEAGGHDADGHTHGAANTAAKTAPRSEVAAHTAFPRAGKYKLWAQFQRAGRVVTAAFVVDVAENGQTAVKAAEVPEGAIKVTIDKNGYAPAEIRLEKGRAATLAFYRADAENCGGEVVFPQLGIAKKLPVGETVLVELGPQEAGELSFACGMQMLKGKILVQ